MLIVGSVKCSQEVRFDAYIRKMWNDPRLAFSDGPEKIHFGYDTAKSFVWMPDLYFTKTTTTQITESFKRDAFVMIKSTGDIRVSLRWANYLIAKKKKFKNLLCSSGYFYVVDPKVPAKIAHTRKLSSGMSTCQMPNELFILWYFIYPELRWSSAVKWICIAFLSTSKGVNSKLAHVSILLYT